MHKIMTFDLSDTTYYVLGESKSIEQFAKDNNICIYGTSSYSTESEMENALKRFTNKKTNDIEKMYLKGKCGHCVNFGLIDACIGICLKSTQENEIMSSDYCRNGFYKKGKSKIMN